MAVQDALLQRAIAKIAKLRHERDAWKHRSNALKEMCQGMQHSLHTLKQMVKAADTPDGGAPSSVSWSDGHNCVHSTRIAAVLVRSCGCSSPPRC
jgi:hypothetical protein